ncbi:MAG: tRNA pseudouridine(55) synthase TruB [Solirubrobacterales bacterium]|nr:tRNA pseudouridine(55) synthase TruB [Solirubrobacterales bacterium]MCB8970082.1 tRNA pseudouridine(55) synthase TruB [Thermoleophilales bacterium]MCO5326908.1 tRNA pseudouridine(55) synthase TruB [Solirubrobacterales bacterium]
MTAGFLRVDKPAGITSHDVVARVRRSRPGVRVGHAGTLDPFATGLLIVLLGPATRLQRYVLGLPKTYVATARLGWRSSTGDPDGELTETGVVPERLELPTGSIRQRVPMTSAVRVGGERLYRKARRGEEVERPLRTVEVMRADLLATDAEMGTATFEIECSSGTYVRTLIEELGDAYCAELRRTAIGPLLLAGATGEEVQPVEELLGFLPAVDLAPERARLVRNGVKIDAPDDAVTLGDGPFRITCSGTLVAVGRVVEGVLRTDVVLPPAADG